MPDISDDEREALAEELKKLIDRHLAHKAAALAAVTDVMRLCQHTPEEWMAMPADLRDFKLLVVRTLEIPCLNLGYGLRRSDEEARSADTATAEERDGRLTQKKATP